MVTKKEDYWIPRSVNEHKKGSLHRMLEVPPSESIPFTFLQEIVNTPIGMIAKNPTQTGKKKIKVTHLVKARANWALNLKRISRKRKE
jgi:hypothetical protein